ncbi:MAG TPA: phosphatase PAP2 family protein [Chloroflexota bacterium]|nr:phosphatase PAP2 family protein [Chloroflexota bacterium]
MRSPWLFGGLLGLAVFLVDLVLVESSVLGRPDRALELDVHQVFGQPTFWFFKDVSDVGAGVGYVLILVLVVVVLLLIRRRDLAVLAALAPALAAAVETVVKVLVRRPRPHLFHGALHASGYSFPSGHATDAGSLAAIAVGTAYIAFHRRDITAPIFVIALVFALAVGLARVVLGVHYPSDVLGGWGLGGGTAGLCFVLLRRARFARDRRREVEG